MTRVNCILHFQRDKIKVKVKDNLRGGVLVSSVNVTKRPDKNHMEAEVFVLAPNPMYSPSWPEGSGDRSRTQLDRSHQQ